MYRPFTRISTWVVALACVAVLLAGQAGADALVPTGRADSGRSLGRTSMAFLGGLRTFGAAVMWNRLDPQFHEYYAGKPPSAQAFMMPTIWIVTKLNPQFVQAYYVAPWVLIKAGRVAGGLALAREGLRNNPNSGQLIGAYAQLLLVVNKDARAAALECDAMRAKGVYWATPLEEWQTLTIARDAYKLTGRHVELAAVVERMKVLDALIAKMPQSTQTEHLDDTNYGR